MLGIGLGGCEFFPFSFPFFFRSLFRAFASVSSKLGEVFTLEQNPPLMVFPAGTCEKLTSNVNRGSGFSQCESDPTADWAYYIREKDDSEYLSKGKRREVLNKSGSVQDRFGVNFAGGKAIEANL